MISHAWGRIVGGEAGRFARCPGETTLGEQDIGQNDRKSSEVLVKYIRYQLHRAMNRIMDTISQDCENLAIKMLVRGMEFLQDFYKLPSQMSWVQHRSREIGSRSNYPKRKYNLWELTNLVPRVWGWELTRFSCRISISAMMTSVLVQKKVNLWLTCKYFSCFFFAVRITNHSYFITYSTIAT